METVLNNKNEFDEFIKNNPAAAVYFSTPDCNVCKVLKPKLKEMLKEDFPAVKFAYVNLEAAEEIAGQFSIFAVPTVIIYFEGKEFFRKSRNISLTEFAGELSRPYEMFTG